MKANLGKMIKDLNAKISTGNNVVKTSDTKWKDFVNSIKELKRKGYLYKEGGTINR